jgi:hypothetical protein
MRRRSSQGAFIAITPLCTITSHNAFSSAFLPRWSLDITVPTGAPVISAIS